MWSWDGEDLSELFWTDHVPRFNCWCSNPIGRIWLDLRMGFKRGANWNEGTKEAPNPIKLCTREKRACGPTGAPGLCAQGEDTLRTPRSAWPWERPREEPHDETLGPGLPASRDVGTEVSIVSLPSFLPAQPVLLLWQLQENDTSASPGMSHTVGKVPGFHDTTQLNT